MVNELLIGQIVWKNSIETSWPDVTRKVLSIKTERKGKGMEKRYPNLNQYIYFNFLQPKLSKMEELKKRQIRKDFKILHRILNKFQFILFFQ
jgi:hypothetical protein